MELYETATIQDSLKLSLLLEQAFKLTKAINTLPYKKELQETTALQDFLSTLPSLEQSFKLTKSILKETPTSINIFQTVYLEDFLNLHKLYEEKVFLTDRYTQSIHQRLKELITALEALYIEGYYVPHTLTPQDTLSITVHTAYEEAVSLEDLLYLNGQLITPGYFYEYISLQDRLYLNGITPLSFFEESSISDILAKQKVSLLSFVEEISISPLRRHISRWQEETRPLDKIRTQHILAGTYTLTGKVFTYGSYQPAKNATVHLISVEPRRNITYTYTDEYGYYKFLGVPPGEYILVALKEGCTVTIARVIINSDYRQDFVIYPINPLYTIEKIYNKYGNVVKLYAIYDETDTFGYRKVTCILLFGDLYGKCYDSYGTLPGYIEPVSENTTITLEDFFGLGKQGLFDYDEEVKQEGNKIIFKSKTPPGDFDALLFTLKFPSSIDGKFKFSIGNLPSFPPYYHTPYCPYRDYPTPSVIYYDTPTKRVKKSRRGSREERRDESYGAPGTANPGAGIPSPGIPTLEVSEELEIRESISKYYIPPPPPIPPPTPIPPIIYLSETVKLSDNFAEKPWITVTGRCVDIYGNPVPNVNVLVYSIYEGREYLILTTKSDENGFYSFSVPSHTKYRVKWSGRGYYLVEGTVYVADKDILEERARIGIESELTIESGTTFYYEVIFVFYALSPTEGGKIYGYVYNSVTKEKIPGAIITAVRGKEEFTDVSDENGYYEIIVPRGKYTLIGEKPGFKRKQYEVEISSNWHQDIYLDPVVMTIYVYDAIDSKPELKPIQNARIIVSGKNYYTDENGKAEVYVIPGETITIEKARYKSIQIKAVEGERTVFMHPAYKYIRLEERVRLR